MKTISALLALTAISAFTSPASASPLMGRDLNPQYSLYAKFMQESLLMYPFGDEKPMAEKVGECFARIEAEEAATVKRSNAVAVEPDFKTTSPPITGNTGLVIRQDAALSIDGFPWWDSNEVNDHFIWVTEIRDKVVDTCVRLMKEIDDRGLTKDGGVGQFMNIFTNGHDKQGHQFKDNMKVVATFVPRIYSPAGMAFEMVKDILKGVKDICVDALQALATKETGCTADLNYYRPSKAKGYTRTGAIGGLTHILWKDTPFAALKLDLTNA